jgi:broad specificity phosphatase PhoE
VLIVTHQVVVLCLRYLIEELTEEEILAIDSAADVANCSVTEYRLHPEDGENGSLRLHGYNLTAHLQQEGAPVTREPDAAVAAR